MKLNVVVVVVVVVVAAAAVVQTFLDLTNSNFQQGHAQVEIYASRQFVRTVYRSVHILAYIYIYIYILHAAINIIIIIISCW